MFISLFTHRHFVDVPASLDHLRSRNNNWRRHQVYQLKCCLLAAGFTLAPALVPALAPALAQAQSKPAFTADKIIQHFSDPAALGGARGLGAQRAVCAGTEAECARASAGGGQSAQASASASSFDLMIQFNLDSDRLTDPARRNLDEFANALRDPRLKSFSFAVEGHTDARGTDDHNLGSVTPPGGSCGAVSGSKGRGARPRDAEGFRQRPAAHDRSDGCYQPPC